MSLNAPEGAAFRSPAAATDSRRSTHSGQEVRRTGRISLVTFLAVLALIYIGNVFGPPPPNVQTLAWTALALWLFPLWAWHLDRHRTPLHHV